jgi:hypothetical protein
MSGNEVQIHPRGLAGSNVKVVSRIVQSHGLIVNQYS